jgi:hypothetical protein
MELVRALAAGRYDRAIELVIGINASVMQRREGSAAWIVIERDRIRVRLADERTDLPSVAEAEDYWRSTYFINSLWRVSRAVAA